MLPKGWDVVHIGSCVEMLTGFPFPSSSYVESSASPVRLLRGDNIIPGSLRWEDAKHFQTPYADNLNRYEMREGDIVIALDRPVVGAGLKCSVVKRHDLPCLLVQRVARLRATAIDQGYLSQTVQTRRFVTHLLNNKTETAVPHISPNDIRAYTVPLPRLDEQRRIADVLVTWDEAIIATEKLLATARKQKQELRRSLLSGKRHLARARGCWGYQDFDEVFERVARKNTIGNPNVLTISGQLGLVSQGDYFNKSVASENLGGYTLLERGDFAYNRSYSKGYPVGAIKPLLAYDAGVVSSLYLCFRFKQGVEADFDFFRHYFEAGLLNEEISSIAQEGARNHGLLNVSVSDFFKLRLHVPPAIVQREIAEVINVAEAEEKLLGHQLEKLQTEKRALMQQLLTGKRRVRLPAVATKAAA